MATVRIQVRRGTASQWSTTNPVLAAGEMGVETDTNLFKFGNGTSTWTALSYANNSDVAIGEISQDAINNALSLGAGLTKSYNDGTNTIEITVDSDVIALKSYVDARETAIQNTADATYIPQDDRGAANGVASLNAQGKVPTSEIDLTVVASREYAEYLQTQDLAALTIHTDKSLNVHGIPDTSVLATDGDVTDALNAAKNYTDTKHGIAENSIASLGTSSAAYADTKKAEAITAAEAYADTVGTTAQSFATGAVSTHNATTTSVHGIADTSLLATKSYADTAADNAEAAAITAASDALGVHAADTTSVHGIADTSALATKSYADNAVSTHEADTTNVHGIADTSALATKTYADGKASDAQTAATSAASTALSAHEADTTNVHGIEDTTKLVKTDAASQTLSGNLTISGNLTVSGTTTTVNTTNFTTADPVIYLGEGNNSNSVDLGFVASYNDGTYAHQGLVKDTSDGKWKLFKGVTDEPTTTVNFAQGSMDALKVGAFEATTVTPSSGIVFSDGTQVKVGVPSITAFATAISSSATLASGEQDKFVPLTGAVTITLPATGYSTGQSIDFYQESGTGAQFASTNSVVGTPGLKLRTTNSVATAMKTASGWLVFGDLSA